jgi:hypothetical protein
MKTFTLVDDWDAILKRAWSIKFSLLAAAFGFGEVLVQLLEPAGIPGGLLVGVATMISAVTPLVRVLAQKEIVSVAVPQTKQ